MKIKLESINSIIRFRNELKISQKDIDFIKGKWWEEKIEELCFLLDIKRDEVDVTMVTLEKTISEVLYQKNKFRIVRTKNCKSLLQIKQDYKSKNKEGFIWKDHAFYATGSHDECFENAKNEIDRLKGKRKYSRKGGPSKRQKFMDKMNDSDKALLDSLL